MHPVAGPVATLRELRAEGCVRELAGRWMTTATLGVLAAASVAVGAVQLNDDGGPARASTTPAPEFRVAALVGEETGTAGPPADDEVAAEGPIGAPVDLPGPDGPPDPVAEGSVTVIEPGVLRFVYFVEADQEFDPAAVDAIERQAQALQRYWYDQFGGTFHLPAGGVEVVYGRHPAQWYEATPNGADERWYRLLNIRDEMAQAGVAFDGSGARVITFPNARIDGRVGANRYEGAWMDGDDISCIDGIVETTPYSADFPADCLATLAHEVGHVYGLGHSGAESDCMQYGFYRYATAEGICDFSPEHVAQVVSDDRNVGWLDARPGDRR